LVMRICLKIPPRIQPGLFPGQKFRYWSGTIP
jgi:hypothetical protein